MKSCEVASEVICGRHDMKMGGLNYSFIVTIGKELH
jgi:hypothetical protein